MINPNDRFYKVRFTWRSFISQYPRLNTTWKSLRAPVGVAGISKHATDLVLEGYPRSGNSFVWYAFMMAQTRPYNIIRHAHIPARVVGAVKIGVPTLLLIRNPKDCVLSFCIYEPRLTFKLGLTYWIRFYQTLKPYRDGYVLANFDQVINDFGQVITAVNDRFGTQFDIFDHTPENEKLVFEMMEFRTKLVAERVPFQFAIDNRIGRPSDTRKQKKKEYEAELLGDKKLANILAEAQKLYESLVEQ